VDHIEDSREDYSDDNSRENLAALCHECHSVKTAASMGKGVYLGCDVNGRPLDPDHPWNKSPATGDSKTARSLLFQR
jgi:cytochrome c2